MTATYYITPTNYGLSQIAEAHDTASITLANLVLGDANGIPYAPSSALNRTTLFNQRASIPIQSVTVIDEQTVRVIATIGNNVGGFNIHELGLTDSTGQLVYIGNYHGGYKPVLTEGAGGELALYIDIKPEQGGNVLIQAINPVTANQNWVINNFVSIPVLEQYQAQNTLEHNNLLTLIAAAAQNAQISIDDAIDYLTSLLQQHRDAINPHPQYLLASTFGVHLLMTASPDTPIDDAHRVLGWNGESGDKNIGPHNIRWWNTFGEKVTFKPYRAYGQFLLSLNFQPQGWGRLWVRTYNKNGILISDVLVKEIYDTHQWHDRTNHVFELPQDGYAEIEFWIEVWNRSYGVVEGSIYVDDRVKRFLPVGYTSIVDETNFNTGGSTTQQNDYSVFPNFEWFYYSNSSSAYVQLSSGSTLENPVHRVPHFYRKNSLGLTDTDVYVIVEAGTQSTNDPSDYAEVMVDYSQAYIDENGDVVIGIPFSMRSISIPEGAKAVYRVAYYTTETEKTDSSMPSGSIDGEHIIFVDPT